MKSAYKVTAVRRVLKEDSVPELRFQVGPAAGEFSRTEDLGFLQKDSSSVDNASNAIPLCKVPLSAVRNSTCVTPTTSKRRPILGSITRKNRLTPTAHRLHGLVVSLLKKQSKNVHELGTLRQRLENAEKYIGQPKMTELKKFDQRTAKLR